MESISPVVSLSIIGLKVHAFTTMKSLLLASAVASVTASIQYDLTLICETNSGTANCVRLHSQLSLVDVSAGEYEGNLLLHESNFRWNVEVLENKSVQFMHDNSSRCLVLDGSSLTTSADCGAFPFTLVGDTSFQFQISGKCLDFSGENVGLSDCAESAHWSFVDPAARSTPAPSQVVPNQKAFVFILDAAKKLGMHFGLGKTLLKLPYLMLKNYTENDLKDEEYLKMEWYRDDLRIRNAFNDSECFSSGNLYSGAIIQSVGCSHINNMMFEFVPQNDGLVQIKAAHAKHNKDLCVTVMYCHPSEHRNCFQMQHTVPACFDTCDSAKYQGFVAGSFTRLMPCVYPEAQLFSAETVEGAANNEFFTLQPTVTRTPTTSHKDVDDYEEDNYDVDATNAPTIAVEKNLPDNNGSDVESKLAVLLLAMMLSTLAIVLMCICYSRRTKDRSPASVYLFGDDDDDQEVCDSFPADVFVEQADVSTYKRLKKNNSSIVFDPIRVQEQELVPTASTHNGFIARV